MTTGLNIRLAKELRQFLLPGCIVAAAGIVWGVAVRQEASEVVSGIARIVLAGGIALIAAMSFGIEFQQRTLPLLLSQPQARERLWQEKLRAMGLTVGAILLACLFGLAMAASNGQSDSSIFDNFPVSGVEVVLAGVFVAATVCSGPFWALVARSTIGGMVFAIASQFLFAGLTALVAQRVFGADFTLEEPAGLGMAVVLGALYCAVFLKLGRRRLEHWEAKEVQSMGNGFVGENSISTRSWAAWLRCQPGSNAMNLIRKELCLLKPVFTICAVLVFCWLFTIALLLLQPSRHEVYETILNVLTAGFLILLTQLAACISVGEEKSLGLLAWHLTLPVSVFRQWLVKFGTGLIVAAALGVALPWILSRVTPIQSSVGVDALIQNENLPMVLITCGGLFVLGFWASTLSTNAVRGELMTVIAAGVLAFCASAGVVLAQLADGLETPLFIQLVARQQLPPTPPAELFADWRAFCKYLTGGLMFAILLIQSFKQFRRVEVRKNTLVGYCCTVALCAFLFSFWNADLELSVRRPFDFLQEEVLESLRAVTVQSMDLTSTNERAITLEQLKGTGNWSEQTGLWLRNASITDQGSWPKANNGRQWHHARICFGNGREYVFHYEIQVDKR